MAILTSVAYSGCGENDHSQPDDQEYHQSLSDSKGGTSDRDSLGTVELMGRFVPEETSSDRGNIHSTQCNLTFVFYLAGENQNAWSTAEAITQSEEFARLNSDRAAHAIWLDTGNERIPPQIVTIEQVGPTSPYIHMVVVFPETACQAIPGSDDLAIRINHPLEPHNSATLRFSSEQLTKYVRPHLNTPSA